MVTMLPVVRRPIVIVCSVIPTVIVIIATGIIPVISRIAVIGGMRGNRIQLRLLRRRLKPERQLVLLEPEPVRLLPMEVKEVFS